MDSEHWRNSYDAWKTREPCEYEEEYDEASLIEEDAWRAGYEITRAEVEAIVEERRRRDLGLPPGRMYGPFDPRPKPVEVIDDVPF